jgi:phosphate transport system permease protein
MKISIDNGGSTRGESQIWLTGSALALVLLSVLGLLLVVCVNGLGMFWPSRLLQVDRKDGTHLLGEQIVEEHGENRARLQLKVGNRDLYGSDFVWIDQSDIASQSFPDEVITIERTEWGKFFGTPTGMKIGVENIEYHSGGDNTQFFDRLNSELSRTKGVLAGIRSIEQTLIGSVSKELEKLRLERKRLVAEGNEKSAETTALDRRVSELQNAYRDYEAEVGDRRARLYSTIDMADVNGQTKTIKLDKIDDYYPANRLTLLQRSGRYCRGVWNFITGEPRESNTEGGVFPAVFGTVLMVILMSIVTTPLGVIAALYLREYSRPSKLVSLVRICVSNLAGVPSIVYGVFGLGFFVYVLGANIDQLFFSDTLPTPTFGTGGILWASLTLAILTLPTVIVTTEEGLAAIPRHLREASYALGATKAETVIKVILPALSPAILTGVILATARAAGEVAPLMVTGVVKLAPSLPVDGQWPFLHFDRKFMHLGFHIFDVGFQSPNVEAARPMVFATTVLLLLIVILLNVTAVIVRAKLRKKYSSSAI